MAETLTLSHLSGARPDRVAERSPKAGLFARVVAAMIEQRQRQADHHIARYIERHGGKITDTVERGIESRILSPAGGSEHAGDPAQRRRRRWSRLLERLRSATSLTHSGLRLVGATFAEARQMQLEARRRFHFLDD